MFYQWQDKNLILNCRIQPNANVDEIADVMSDILKIRITAAPIDGRANQHLIKYLSKMFKAPQNKISILTGSNNREKRLCITAPKRLPPELNIAVNIHA